MTTTEENIIETIYDKLTNNKYNIKLYEKVIKNIFIDYQYKTIEFNINGKSYKLKLVRE